MGLRRGCISILVAAALGGACASPPTSPSTVPVVPPSPPPAAAEVAREPAATAGQPAPAPQRVRYGTLRIVPDAGIFVGIDEGFFAEQGIEVELVPFDSTAFMIAPLATNQLEAGGGAPSAGMYNALRSGVDLRIVADRGHNDPTPPGFPAAMYLVRKALVDRGQVRGIADLKGLRLGRAAPATAGEVDLTLLLARGGLTLQDLDVVSMSYPDQVSAFANDNLDFGIGLEPFATIAQSQGSVTVLAYDYQVNPYHQVAVMLYSPDFSQSDLAVKFMVAYLKGIRQYIDAFMRQDPAARERTIDTLINHTVVKTRALYDQMTMAAFDPDGKMNLASFDQQQDFFMSVGAQPERVDMQRFIDLRPAEAAARQLGPHR